MSGFLLAGDDTVVVRPHIEGDHVEMVLMTLAGSMARVLMTPDEAREVATSLLSTAYDLIPEDD